MGKMVKGSWWKFWTGGKSIRVRVYLHWFLICTMSPYQQYFIRCYILFYRYGKTSLSVFLLASTLGRGQPDSIFRHRLNKPVLSTSGFWVSISIINILVCITTSVDSMSLRSTIIPITKFTCMWNCPNHWLHTVHIWQKKLVKPKGCFNFV